MADPQELENVEQTGEAVKDESLQTPGESETPSILSLVGDIAPIDNAYQHTADGSLVLGVNGLPKRRPGRPRKNPSLRGDAAASTAESSPASSPSKSPVQRKANREASAMLASMLINTAVAGLTVSIGEEWQFQSQEETDSMKGAVTAYLESKGDSAITPEGMLALAVAAYALPRTAHENTRQKLGKFFGSIWRFLTGPFKRD